nr:Os06g0343500 protein [Ipomoea batatas]
MPFPSALCCNRVLTILSISSLLTTFTVGATAGLIATPTSFVSMAAFIFCSANSGHATIGTLFVRLSKVEFHPQWDRNPPTDGWVNISTWLAHIWTKNPTSRVRERNPSGRVAVLAPKKMSPETSQELFLEEYISNPIASSKPVASKAQTSLNSDTLLVSCDGSSITTNAGLDPWEAALAESSKMDLEHQQMRDELALAESSKMDLAHQQMLDELCFHFRQTALNLNNDLAGRNGRACFLMISIRSSSFRPWQHKSPFDEALMTTGSGRRLKDGPGTPADVG